MFRRIWNYILNITKMRRRRVYCVTPRREYERNIIYSPMPATSHVVCYEDDRTDVVDREVVDGEDLDEILLVLCTESELLMAPVKQ